LASLLCLGICYSIYYFECPSVANFCIFPFELKCDDNNTLRLEQFKAPPWIHCWQVCSSLGGCMEQTSWSILFLLVWARKMTNQWDLIRFFELLFLTALLWSFSIIYFKCKPIMTILLWLLPMICVNCKTNLQLTIYCWHTPTLL
jgi:hypothetical protein